MEIIPERQEYIFSVMNHTMRSVVEHMHNMRKISYFFDEKMVAQKNVPGGEFYTDDECISEVVQDYRRHKKDAYADLFNNHMDKVFLAAKLLKVKLVNYGIEIEANIKVFKGSYEIEFQRGDNYFSSRFNAENFSEALEKMRIFTHTLDGISMEMAEKIHVLSNDKIASAIKWQD